MPTLFLSPRYTEDSQSLWRAAMRLGWSVHRLVSWRIPDEMLGTPDPVLYIEGLMGPTVAAQLGVTISQPPEDWLPRLPATYRLRDIQLMTLGKARNITTPAFVKPPNDKSFPAKVYSGSELPREFDDAMPVLVAEVVRWEKEFRCFILDRQARTISISLRNGELQRDADFEQSGEELAAASAFAAKVLADPSVDMPRAAVLDIGVIEGRGWAVVEQNSAWGAGLYGCDPEQVLHVLRHTATPLAKT